MLELRKIDRSSYRRSYKHSTILDIYNG